MATKARERTMAYDTEATLPTTNSLTMRFEIQNKVGMMGMVTSAIGEGGGSIGVARRRRSYG